MACCSHSTPQAVSGSMQAPDEPPALPLQVCSTAAGVLCSMLQATSQLPWDSQAACRHQCVPFLLLLQSVLCTALQVAIQPL